MSDDYKNLPSIDDFEESNEELPSVADLLEEKAKGPSTVNNALFVGSTSELSKLLKAQTKKEDK